MQNVVECRRGKKQPCECRHLNEKKCSRAHGMAKMYILCFSLKCQRHNLISIVLNNFALAFSLARPATAHLCSRIHSFVHSCLMHFKCCVFAFMHGLRVTGKCYIVKGPKEVKRTHTLICV